MAIGRAMELGFLNAEDLQKPIVELLPKIDRTKIVTGAEKITLHQVLNMNSGLRVSKTKLQELRKIESL